MIGAHGCISGPNGCPICATERRRKRENRTPAPLAGKFRRSQSIEWQIHNAILHCEILSGQRPEKVPVSCDVMQKARAEVVAQMRGPVDRMGVLKVGGVPLEETLHLPPGQFVAWLKAEE